MQTILASLPRFKPTKPITSVLTKIPLVRLFAFASQSTRQCWPKPICWHTDRTINPSTDPIKHD
jgi:hypothetical protein